MKIIYDNDLMEIASAGLRCGRWFIKHFKDKKPGSNYLKGYHAGKAYAYLWMLTKVGLVEFMSPDVQKMAGFKRYKGNRVHIFPKCFTAVTVLMDRKFFEKVLTSKQNQQGPRIVKEIRKLCD